MNRLARDQPICFVLSESGPTHQAPKAAPEMVAVTYAAGDDLVFCTIHNTVLHRRSEHVGVVGHFDRISEDATQLVSDGSKSHDKKG